MQKVIPPELKIDVSARPLALSDATLSRADGAVVLLEKTARPDKAVDTLPQAAVWRKLLRGASAQRPGIADSRDAAAQSQPDARRRRLREARRHRFRAARPGRQAGARSAQARRGAPAAACKRVHCARRTHGRARSRAERRAGSRGARCPSRSRRPPLRTTCAGRTSRTGHRALYDRSVAIAAGNHLARWLATLPPNVLDSIALSRRAAEARAPRRLVVQVLRHRPAREAGCRRVPRRRARQPASWRGHRATHLPAEAHAPHGGKQGATGIALVGKGICFDTGGINLKPHRGMYTMHGDMQGSAVAVGTLLALTRLEASYPIDCWLAITENQIGPNAFRPQEIVHALNGVTIQVVHSDAEGRMVLADTLTLASREKPRFVLDFATLTGACVNALTDRYAGAFTNRAGLHDWLQQTGTPQRRARLVLPDGRRLRHGARVPRRRRPAVHARQQGRPHPGVALPQQVRRGDGAVGARRPRSVRTQGRSRPRADRDDRLRGALRRAPAGRCRRTRRSSCGPCREHRPRRR